MASGPARLTALHDPLRPAPSDHWHQHLVGDGRIEPSADGVRLRLPPVSGAAYHDSQMDDYHGRTREDFPWRPPLTLNLRARFSGPASALVGTAGFGWWNDPFAGDRATALAAAPQVLWFFAASPPAMLATTAGWSGHGFFAQGLNTPPIPGWIARLGTLALRFPPLAALARRGAAGVSRAAEQPLPAVELSDWHDYRIDWGRREARFLVDDTVRLIQPAPPSGPLALVLWMDNQWATVAGDGGLLALPRSQWLEVADLHVTPGPDHGASQ